MIPTRVVNTHVVTPGNFVINGFNDITLKDLTYSAYLPNDKEINRWHYREHTLKQSYKHNSILDKTATSCCSSSFRKDCIYRQSLAFSLCFTRKISERSARGPYVRVACHAYRCSFFVTTYIHMMRKIIERLLLFNLTVFSHKYRID